MEKQILRDKLLKLRNELSDDLRRLYSKDIQNKTRDLEIYQKAKTILYFASFRSEVDTLPLIKDGLALKKRVVLPITDTKRNNLIFSELHDFQKELARGTYGILEPKPEFYRPVSAETIDLVLIPGLVFDQRGYRIGYGGGYYDRFLANPEIHPILLALAFDLQISEKSISVEPHDIPVDFIVTEKREIDCKEKRKEVG